ncbi:protein disulfide isomerase family A, member 7 isoform X2 [Ictalurus furcatus]|uniref:protein disulfide isomerase family A, member 7 isoform X2 n=1 Tax=Ictalurus furcatus TaxID=66913 RepID=UPI00234FE5CB|nr:protein disulfide isomerase family A, member 7 isoform X2 [Ictalurus furcatus]
MRLSYIALLCLGVLHTVGVFAEGSGDVLELEDAGFERRVAEHETLLVEFFAPWCGHCKRLAPEYEAAATRLKGTVPLAKVDCTANSETCEKFGVNGYPTLKIFRNGELASSYDGPRTADGIVSYMKKQAGPSSIALHSEAELDAFINGFDASVVGFFSGSDHLELAAFLKASSALRDSYRFAHTTDLGIGLKYGVDRECVLLFRPPHMSNVFEDSVLKFSDSVSTSTLRTFLMDNIFGLCPHLTSENRDSLRSRDLLTAYYDVDYVRNPKGTNYWRNRVMKVATQFLSRGLSFAVADQEEFQEELAEEFGLQLSDGGEMPLITIRTRAGHKYIMQEEFTRDGKSLERFLEDYFADHLKKYIKSEPVPETNDGPVKVVVADTFDEIVNNPEKDVLVEFFAPWCSHCKNLEPTYTELGEKLSGDSHIVVAKMDATANDIPPDYDVQGFPTIYFAPAGQKDQPRRYEGGREVSDFISYLKKEATNPLVFGNLRDDL